MASKAREALGLKRAFHTPEGVELRLELGSAGARAGAFMIDVIIILVILTVMTVALVFLFGAFADSDEGSNQAVSILWLLGSFVLRNGWFTLFELGRRGATPGKRLLGLRVVARDGATLSGSAVVARNAMREIEIFLPISFLASQTANGLADTFLVIFSLLWSGIFLFFPLFNRDRLRVGDLVAGTWVVTAKKLALSYDLVGSSYRHARTFPHEALELYGIYELQTLETILRNEDPATVKSVAKTIRGKADLPDDGDDFGFLSDYYAALCGHLEAELSVGRRKENKLAS